MKTITAILTIMITTSLHAQQKKMAITVDDLPVVTYGISDPQFQTLITQRFMHIFDEFDVPAIGYVNENKLYVDGELNPVMVTLLEMWVENGYELGNHSYSHMNYHNVSFDEFTSDILRGEEVTRKLMRKFGRKLQFFRHPYLRIGRSKGHADSLRHFLDQHGYTEAPVTIDNVDYLFAQAYSKAFESNDFNLMAKIGESYVDYMEEKLLFYEKSSNTLFGRNISQTLLIHANLLNSDYLDELIRMYQRHDYTFISQSEVLADVGYDEEITRYGNWGISWIDRWAISRGVDRDFLEGDPKTPELIQSVLN